MAEKRSSFWMFLNTGTGDTATYSKVGKGVTELTVSYNAQTTTEQYIDEDTANTEITGYQPNAPVTAQVIKGDHAFEYINAMRKKLPTMSDAYSDIVLVDAFESVSSDAYPATRQKVSIQMDSYGGAATDPLSISYTINWRGTGEEGTFNPTTKTFTPGSAAPEMMNFNDKEMEV